MKTAVLFFAALAPLLAQRILNVGPNQPYKTITNLPAVLLPGDQIIVEPGLYTDARAWPIAGTPESPVTVQCAVRRACIFDGADFNFAFTPRAQFQVAGGAYTFIGFTMRNVHNGGNNASAIRCIAGQCIILDNHIRNADMGIHATAPSLVVLRNNDIAWNGRGQNSHQVYLSGGDHSIIEDNVFFRSTGGMNVKIRTRTSEIRRNQILDSVDGEIQCGNGPTTLAAGADCIIEQNIIRTLPSGRANCCRVLAFGHEGTAGTDRNGTMRLKNNRITLRKADQILVSLDSVNAALDAVGNIIEGSNNLIRKRYGTTGPITGAGNMLRTAAGMFPLDILPVLFVPPTVPLPDTTPPEPVSELAAVKRPLSNVITWKASPSPDVAYYKVNTNYGPFSMGAEPKFQDSAAINISPKVYGIIAVDHAGNESPAVSISVTRP